jgi:LAO/AO transport system kinase
VSVVLTPESGDGIQGMKAGLMEIADTFAVNKADRPGADMFAREIEAALELDPRAMHPTGAPRVFKISATVGTGLREFTSHIDLARAKKSEWVARRSNETRLRAEARALMMVEAERSVLARSSQIKTPADLGQLLRTI